MGKSNIFLVLWTGYNNQFHNQHRIILMTLAVFMSLVFLSLLLFSVELTSKFGIAAYFKETRVGGSKNACFFSSPLE